MLILQLQRKVDKGAGKKQVKLLCKPIPTSGAEVENTHKKEKTGLCLQQDSAECLPKLTPAWLSQIEDRRAVELYFMARATRSFLYMFSLG